MPLNDGWDAKKGSKNISSNEEIHQMFIFYIFIKESHEKSNLILPYI